MQKQSIGSKRDQVKMLKKSMQEKKIPHISLGQNLEKVKVAIKYIHRLVQLQI